MRCFVALDLPYEVMINIGNMVSDLRHLSKSVKWVRPENLHLTLKFLGEVRESDIPELCETLRAIAKKHSALNIKAHGTGAFPSLKKPRVVWVSLQAENGLLALQADMESALVPLGFQKEDRQFKAHLTIGRVKNSRGQEKLTQKLALFEDETFGEFMVNEMVLYKSDLRPAGAEYTPIEVFPLEPVSK